MCVLPAVAISATARTLHRLARWAAKPISIAHNSETALSSKGSSDANGYGARSTSVRGWKATQANQNAIVPGQARPWASKASAVPWARS